MLVNLNHK